MNSTVYTEKKTDGWIEAQGGKKKIIKSTDGNIIGVLKCQCNLEKKMFCSWNSLPSFMVNTLEFICWLIPTLQTMWWSNYKLEDLAGDVN